MRSLNSISCSVPACAITVLFGVSLSSTITAETVSSGTQPRDIANYIASAPRPEYPSEARLHRFTGSGLALLKIDKQTGEVTSARMLRSTGHKILDDAALKAYRGWRFKPETISNAQVPITFSMTGDPLESLNAAGDALSAPRPEYPIEARMKHWTGSGAILMEVDPRTGHVTAARMLKSTGHQVLDESALKSLRQWQFRPHTWSPVRVPIRFTAEGVKYK